MSRLAAMTQGLSDTQMPVKTQAEHVLDFNRLQPWLAQSLVHLV